MSEKLSAAQRSAVMSKIRKKDTKPELIARKYLFAHGFRYRLHEKKLPGNPDIVLPKYRTAIFVNGCFWHAHEGCKLNRLPKSRPEYWIPKIRRNVERDGLNKTALEKLGWKTITVWECELKGSKIEETMNKVISNLRVPE